MAALSNAFVYQVASDDVHWLKKRIHHIHKEVVVVYVQQSFAILLIFVVLLRAKRILGFVEFVAEPWWV